MLNRYVCVLSLLQEYLPENLATSPIPSDIALMEEGLRRLHAGNMNQDPEKQSSQRESTAGSSSQRSQEDVERLVNYLKEPEDMRELENLGRDVEVTVETEVGRGKNKRQLKLTGSLKGKEDTDSQSSLDDNRDGRHMQQALEDGIMGLRSSNQKARTKLRKKRKRDTKGKISSSLSSTDIKTTRRQFSLSDSDGSFSSSDELDTNGMFTMEDVDNLSSPRVPPILEPHSNQEDVLKEMSQMTSEDWNALSMPPSDKIFHVFSEGDMTPLIRYGTT